MAHVSCPCCEEIVRLSVDSLPEDASVRCPWCSATLPAADWLINLPPAAIILGANGEPLKSLDTQAAVQVAEETPPVVEATETQDAADTIDLDEPLSCESPSGDSPSELSGSSIVSFDVDEFPNELSLAQPTIDEIENAWDTTEEWDPPGSTIATNDADDDIDTSMSHELGGVDDVSVSPGRVRNDDHRAEFQRHQWARKRRKMMRLLKIASPTLLAIPIIGGILIYSGADLGFYPFDGPASSVLANVSQPLPVDPSAKKTRAQEGSGSLMDGIDPSFDHDSNYVTIEEVIQSLDGRGQEFAEDPATDTDTKRGVTIEMIARQQREARGGKKETVVTQEVPVEHGHLLLPFPRQPPSANSVRQANAEFSQPVTPMESPEMIAACELAINSVRKLVPDESGDLPSGNKLKERLLAFRDISRVGSLAKDVDSPRVDEMLSELASSSALAGLIPLCSEWIGWRGRKTDGMLLIGQLQGQDGETYVELADGSRVDVQLDENRKFPVESQCVMLCKIIPGNKSSRVQLVTGVLVP